MAHEETKEAVVHHLIPEILFATKELSVADGAKKQYPELVTVNSPLVRLSPSTDPQQEPPPCQLLEGINTYLGKDETKIFSRIDGYPQITKSVKKGIDQLLVTVFPLCHIPRDKMTATISLCPPVSMEALTVEQIITILHNNKICFGFNEDHIQSLLERNKNASETIEARIACGIPPIDGKDSFLRFAIEVGPFPGKVLGDGTIDFRERKMFVGVKKGQTIAIHIPATEGTPGINICKETVGQIPGRNLPVNVSDDANYDEQSGVITAKKNGVLSMVGENSLKVCAKQVISGNIDYNTGNIESQNAMEIKGSILPGFKVHTRGDLFLGGNIRSAKIKCHGNLVVKGGILGQKCAVNVKGDADFTFMEHGKLRAQGNVVIRKQAYHTKIVANGDIRCAKESQIMTSELLCGGSISLGTVGSQKSPKTLLAAGVSPAKYLRYMSLDHQLEECNQELTLFLQRFGMEKKINKRKSLENHIKFLKREMNKIDLIPEDVTDISTISIAIHGTLFSGTKIQIANSVMIIRRDRTSTRFYLDKKKHRFSESAL